MKVQMGKGKNRDWGYASSDENGNLTYTSYEKNGSVNRYTDNGDGGHSHSHWRNSSDYNSGNSPDWSRSESGKNGNPSTGEVQSGGGCYLTTACMKHYLNNFNDDCYELRVLRWFRDNYVAKDDVMLYYALAPSIVSSIEKEQNSDLVYDYIYDNVVDYCVSQIEFGNYNEAYARYKDSIKNFKEYYLEKSTKNL